MKTIHVCHPDGRINIVDAPLGTTLADVAQEFPAANLYWLDAPITAARHEYSVIRYTPQ